MRRSSRAASSGNVMPANMPRIRLICSPWWCSSCARMLASVSCILGSAHPDLQSCRTPAPERRCSGGCCASRSRARARLAAPVGCRPAGWRRKTRRAPRASITSTRSMSRSWSRRPAIEAIRGDVARSATAGASSAPVASATLSARASRSAFQLLLDCRVGELIDVGGRRCGARSTQIRRATAIARRPPPGRSAGTWF